MKLALLLLWALPASAELPAGVYAVICGQSYRGKDRAQALARCEHGQKDGRRRCGCEHADVITIDKRTRPSLFVAGCYFARPTRKEAIAACHSNSHSQDDPCRCQNVRAAYGPFHRKPVRDDMDNAEVFRYLTDDGYWMDQDGNPPCFPAGTAVLTPSGARPIEEISVGDEVVSRDHHGLTTARVTHTKTRQAKQLVILTLEGGTVLRATPNHPIATPSGWVDAGELAPGEVVMTHDGERQLISLEAAGGAEVYDLTVEPTHSYFAEGVWVHNY